MIPEYLILLALFCLISFIVEKTQHIHLYHNRKERIEITLFFFVISILWDSFAIWRGHWIYPANQTLGITIGVLPLEEYLFAFIIPYFIITFYKLLDSKFRGKRKKNKA